MQQISGWGTPVWKKKWGGCQGGLWQDEADITKEECDGVEDVAQDELQSELVDVDPGEQTVDKSLNGSIVRYHSQ
jgi:hypothetical protein